MLCRTLPRQRTQQWSEQFLEKRRSEVDRRLDSLINQSSRALRQVNRTTVLKLLRLFNLCDLGTNSADKDKAKQAHGSPRRPARPRAVQNAVDHSEVIQCFASLSYHAHLMCTVVHCECKLQCSYPHHKALLLYLSLLYNTLAFPSILCPALPFPVLPPDAEHP